MGSPAGCGLTVSPESYPFRLASRSERRRGSVPGMARRIRRSARSKKRVRSSRGFQTPTVMQ